MNGGNGRAATFVSTACLKNGRRGDTLVAKSGATCRNVRLTSFAGWAVPTRRKSTVTTQNGQRFKTWIKRPSMVVDPWSVSAEAVDQIAAQLFAASLFPYLGFLYFLSKKETNCPSTANFGFRFLLAFVGATIPAGIYAKVAYHDILANVDWLHGSAESLLTVTNFIIVLGFRNAFFKLVGSEAGTSARSADSRQKVSQSPAIVAALALALFASTGLHTEPMNALSFPTWIIHISSLFEWLAAMGLVWQYANITGNQRWKGLVWGMLPLHTSGLCACTYHLFYNAPALNALVALQAGLTCFGNATMALATYRIANAPAAAEAQASSTDGEATMAPFVEGGQESNVSYFTKVFVASAVVSVLLKWGSLAVDWPFDPTWPVALSLIFVPTGLNVIKWAVRSQTSQQQFGGLL